MAGATPFPHQSQYRLLLPSPRLQPSQDDRRHGHTKAANPLCPGRPPPAIPWAWWMKPLLSRTSSKAWRQTSAWQPSAKCCLSRRQSGKPGCPTTPGRRQAARLGGRAKAAVRAELRCRPLGPPRLVTLITGPCPDSGSFRGQSRRQTRGPQCPALSPRGPRENRLTSLRTPATLGVGGGRTQLNQCDKKTRFADPIIN